LKKIYKNLTFWVLSSIAIGILIGYISPATGVAMQPLGTKFIDLVKLFISPIILLTIITGICGMSDLKKVGKIGGKAILYFEIVTTIALIIGVVVTYFIQPGAHVDISHIQKADISKYSQSAAAFSWINFFKYNLTIQVLLFAIVAGIVISKLKHKSIIIAKVTWASKYVFKGLHYVMYLAPIGAMGGMAYTIGKYGIDTLLPLMKLMVCVYITMGLFVLLVLGSILKYCKVNIFSFLNSLIADMTKLSILLIIGMSCTVSSLMLSGISVQPNTTAFAPRAIKLSTTDINIE